MSEEFPCGHFKDKKDFYSTLDAIAIYFSRGGFTNNDDIKKKVREMEFMGSEVYGFIDQINNYLKDCEYCSRYFQERHSKTPSRT